MQRKDRIDATGTAILIAFSFLMGLNQVLVKIVNDGFAPVFQVGLRSACALGPILLYAWLRGKRLNMRDGSLGPGILCGAFFSAEFVLLFYSLEFTAVSRTLVLFYTMPVWVTVAAHVLIPGERLTARRVLGLVLAVAGVGVALLDDAPAAGPNALIGDLMALAGAACWAGIALTVRTTRLQNAEPELQIVYQLAVSAVVLLPLAPLFGETIRAVTPQILGVFAFQVIFVVCIGFVSWFWVLRVYPASDMTAFSFLAPLFGVICAGLILDETITPEIWIALVLVGGGIALISWRPRR